MKVINNYELYGFTLYNSYDIIIDKSGKYFTVTDDIGRITPVVPISVLHSHFTSLEEYRNSQIDLIL